MADPFGKPKKFTTKYNAPSYDVQEMDVRGFIIRDDERRKIRRRIREKEYR